MSKEEVRQPRKYELLWQEIKKKGKVTVKPASTSDALFKRIRAAVIKEKCNDLAFKFEKDDRSTILEVNRTPSGLITFVLKTGLGVEDI